MLPSDSLAEPPLTEFSVPVDLLLGDTGEDHPRRLLQLQNHVLAYGGDHGTVSMLQQRDFPPKPDSTIKNTITRNTTTTSIGHEVKVIKKYDDAVRAMAVSYDCCRVALGFDDGSTIIYIYDPQDVATDNLHPFLVTAPLHANNIENEDDDDFLSQTDLKDLAQNSFPGPRMDAPVRHMQFDPRSYHLAIATEAGVCIVDATSSSSLSQRYLQELAEKEHDSSGIRGLCYASAAPANAVTSATTLATLGMDGRLCLWDITAPTNDPNLEYQLLHRDTHKSITKPDVGEIHGADAYDRSCLPIASSSSLSGNLLALPGSTDVHLRSLDNGNFANPQFLASLAGKGHIDTIVAMTFSPDGRHLVSSGRDGKVVLWDLTENQDDMRGRFSRHLGQCDSVPTHLLWVESKQQHFIYMACANGTLITLRDPLETQHTKSKSASMKQRNALKDSREQGFDHGKVDKDAQNGSDLREPDSATSNRKRITKKVTAHVDSDDDIDFHEYESGVQDNGRQATSFLEDEAEEDNGHNEESADLIVNKDDESIDVDDRDFKPDALDYDLEEDSQMKEDARGDSRLHSSFSSVPEPQPAFAPSSTPLDLPRRIMCWNHIGVISLLRGDDGLTRNTVNVDFTDAATRRPISFTDNVNFILGSLGEDGGIFATDLADEEFDVDDGVGEIVDGLHMSDRTKAIVKRSYRNKSNKSEDSHKVTGSSVYFHRFETFGALRDKDWFLTLPDGERALGCACGKGWAAVITSRRFLRFFTAGGNQGQVTWLKGEPVAAVGRSRFLAVIYHESTPLPDGTQKLGYALFDAVSARMITSGSVSCISSGSSLSWAGFSNDCSLMVMDTDGMISMLVGMSFGDQQEASYSWEWSPMLDTLGLRKSPDDTFWPITVQDGKLVCVPLKGGNEHPDAARRPVTTTLGLRMPLARSVLEKSAGLEELSLRATLALKQKKCMENMVPKDSDETMDLEGEYDVLAAQVDKVTLKLFMSTVEAGKLERALDLIDRLHLEKSLDIAMTVADRLNHRNLSDRIYSFKEQKFSVDESVEEKFSHSGEDSPFPRFENHEEKSESTRVSPDRMVPWRSSKRPHDDLTGSDSEHAERQDKLYPSIVSHRSFGKAMNPFGKKILESPARPSMSPGKRDARLKLSRSSTFSKQSREKRKGSKLIL